MPATHTDFLTLLREVRAEVQRTGQKAEIADDPESILFGYRVGSRVWSIRAADLQLSTMAPRANGSRVWQAVRLGLMSHAGRLALANDISPIP